MKAPHTHPDDCECEGCKALAYIGRFGLQAIHPSDKLDLINAITYLKNTHGYIVTGAQGPVGPMGMTGPPGPKGR